MPKTLPFEPPFGWKDDLPAFTDVWSEVDQPDYVNEADQDALWAAYFRLKGPMVEEVFPSRHVE